MVSIAFAFNDQQILNTVQRTQDYSYEYWTFKINNRLVIHLDVFTFIVTSKNYLNHNISNYDES